MFWTSVRARYVLYQALTMISMTIAPTFSSSLYGQRVFLSSSPVACGTVKLKPAVFLPGRSVATNSTRGVFSAAKRELFILATSNLEGYLSVSVNFGCKNLQSDRFNAIVI